MPPPTDRCVGGIMIFGCPSVHECIRLCIACILLAPYLNKPVDRILPNFGWWCSWGDRWTDQFLKVYGIKVTARSNIWLSYCGGRRHSHRCLGTKVSS